MPTVIDAMVLCGVSPAESVILASNLFGDDFETCKDKTMEELDSDFKTYSELTAAQGQIRLQPGVKRKIRAFIQWCRDCYRMGRDPTTETFPVADASDLIRRYKTHEQFVKDVSKVAEAAKPANFTSNAKWEDWYPSFLNYIRHLSGRDGVPLKYICRENDAPDPTAQPDFLDEYVLMAPLTGEAYVSDAATVHTLIVKFIAGNSVAESKIQEYEDLRDGRVDFKALKDHYEGVGVHALDITRAKTDLDQLNYYGERRPLMWWDEFKRRLNRAFVTYDKTEKRQVHSNEMKLRILIDKVRAQFLDQTKATIQIKLVEVPLNFTYEQAIQLFRNTVNQRYPQREAGTNPRRQMNELGSRFNRNNRRHGGRFQRHHGRGFGRNNGRGGRHNNDRNQYKTRPDSTYITLMNGRKVEFHPDITYTNEDFRQMKRNDRDRLWEMRKEIKEKQELKKNIEELRSQVSSIAQTTSSIAQTTTHTNDETSQSQDVPSHVSLSSASTSTSSIASSMFGGRNSQLKRKR